MMTIFKVALIVSLVGLMALILLGAWCAFRQSFRDEAARMRRDDEQFEAIRRKNK